MMCDLENEVFQQEYSNTEVPTRCTCYRVYFIRRLLYMFRVSLSPIFRSTKQLTTASGNRYTVLLSAAIVEELELFHDSNRQQYGVTVTRCCS